MPVVATLLTTDGSTADQDSYTTASVNPSPNRLYLLFVGSTKAGNDPGQPSISGLGMTWAPAGSVLNQGRISTFRAAGSASSGALTIDFAGVTQESCTWALIEVLHVDLTANGANAIVQLVGGQTAGAQASLSITLSAFTSTDNATLGAFFQGDGVSAITEGTGFTELSESPAGFALQTEYKTTNDTSVDWTFSPNANGQGVGIELKFVEFFDNQGYAYFT